MASFNELSPRAQVITFVLVSALAVGAAWQVLLAPATADVDARDARLVSLRAEVAKAAAVAQQLPRMTREVAALEQSLERTTAVLPDEKDAQDVLRQLHTLAKESSLNISSFTPKPVVAKAQYVEWPIELGLEGGYHDLGLFFSKLANLNLLTSVSDLHLKVPMPPKGHSSIEVTCVVTTYVFAHAVPAAAIGALR